MAASGFKGDRVHLRAIEVEGTPTGLALRFTALFQDAEGVTHGSVQHALDPAEDPDMARAVKDLVQSITRWTERAHFNSPNAAGRERTASGIAEALRDAGEPAVFPQDGQ